METKQTVIDFINTHKENLHYISLAFHVGCLSKDYRQSNRKISEATGLSKTEVHRLIQINNFSADVKISAEKYNIEKYIFTDLLELSPPVRKDMEKRIIQGMITRRKQMRNLLQLFWGIKNESKR